MAKARGGGKASLQQWFPDKTQTVTNEVPQRESLGTAVQVFFGAVFGMMFGFVYGIWALLPFVADNVLSSQTGTAAAGAVIGGLFTWFYRIMMNRQTQGKSNTALMVLMSMLVGLTAGLMFLAAYGNEVPDPNGLQQGIIFFLAAIPAGIVGYLLLEFLDDKRPDATQKAIGVNEPFNFMKSRITRWNRINSVKSQLGGHEGHIEFAERPPLVTLLKPLGLPLITWLVARWFYDGRPGYEWLKAGYDSGDRVFVYGIPLTGAVIGVWAIVSTINLITQLSGRTPRAKSEHVRLQKILQFLYIGLVVLVIGGLVFLWGFLGWPWLGWVKDAFTIDPKRLLLLIIIPAATWTIMTILAYMVSYTVLTTNGIHCGTLLDFVPGTSQRFMPRKEMANFEVKRGPIRAMLFYYSLKNEGKGQNDLEWQRVAIRHGKQLRRLLQNKVA